MSVLKNIFFLALCLLLGLGIGKGYVMWKTRGGVNKGMEKHEEPILITGVGDAPGQRGFSIPGSELGSLAAVLKQSSAVFGTSVGLEYSPAVSRTALTTAVKEVHRHHMSFILLPPASFNLQNPYPHPLKEIAADAQAAEVDTLCISWLNAEPDDGYWQQQAGEVRKVFQGRMILAATPDVMPWITAWNAVDIVGAIGPIPLSHRVPTAKSELEMKDLRVSWDSAITSLESLARINTKPLALLHMSVPPEAGHPQVQRLAYEALLVETKGRAQVTDVMLFNWAGADSAENLADVKAKMVEAWDPKKPRLPDPPATDAGGGDDAGDGGAVDATGG